MKQICFGIAIFWLLLVIYCVFLLLANSKIFRSIFIAQYCPIHVSNQWVLSRVQNCFFCSFAQGCLSIILSGSRLSDFLLLFLLVFFVNFVFCLLLFFFFFVIFGLLLKVACPSFCLAGSCRLFPHEFFHVAPTLHVCDGEYASFWAIFCIFFFSCSTNTTCDDEDIIFWAANLFFVRKFLAWVVSCSTKTSCDDEDASFWTANLIFVRICFAVVLSCGTISSQKTAFSSFFLVYWESEKYQHCWSISAVQLGYHWFNVKCQMLFVKYIMSKIKCKMSNAKGQ